jgi:hypothetical protein
MLIFSVRCGAAWSKMQTTKLTTKFVGACEGRLAWR